MAKKGQRRVKWEFKGMAPIGDSHGPIYLWHGTVGGKKIVKAVHGNGKRRFNGCQTLAKAIAQTVD